MVQITCAQCHKKFKSKTARRKFCYTCKRKRKKTQRVEYLERREERIKKAGGSFTPEEFKELKQHYGYCCYYCSKKCKRMDPDHKMPVSRGGNNYISNIVPACRACNRRKGARTPEEFFTIMIEECLATRRLKLAETFKANFKRHIDGIGE